MAVQINLDFATLEELPGKLRVGACTGPISGLQLSARMALDLATRLDLTQTLQADCDTLRRLSHDVMASRADWELAQDSLVGMQLVLARRIWSVVVLSFALGVAAGIGLHFAGWF